MGSARFTEEMHGFHTPGSPAFDAGYVTGTTLYVDGGMSA